MPSPGRRLTGDLLSLKPQGCLGARLTFLEPEKHLKSARLFLEARKMDVSFCQGLEHVHKLVLWLGKASFSTFPDCWDFLIAPNSFMGMLLSAWGRLSQGASPWVTQPDNP
jgi:hypothetical protein